MMIEIIEKLSSEFKDISDFHLRSNSNLAYRKIGDIIIDQNISITNEDMNTLMEKKCNPKDIETFKQTNELDCGFIIGQVRFRANFFRTLQGISAVLRRVETKIPDMESLNLPPILYDAVDAHKGLVLVTGPTGSGKSTTLAAIINQINQTRPANIITIEDPVEFIHKDQRSIISHREVGKQTKSFASALKSALREDPDVILVGELRDLETIGLALTAAETGHLVFGTLHTSGAPNTINRIIDVFPSEQQAQIQAQIAESLKMVVTQKLFKTKDGTSRVGAFEVMVCNNPIKNLIRERKIHQITSIMQTAQRDGMITMEKSIENLLAGNLINQSDVIQ